MSNLQVFNFENKSIRTNTVDSEVMFCLSDVCDALDISNSAVSNFDLKIDGVAQIDTVDSLGRKQVVNFISQRNLFRVIFKSRKDSAIKFQDWVYDEVLDSIGKTGSYSTNKKPDIEEATVEMNRQMRLLSAIGKPKDYELGMLMFEEEMGYHSTIFLPKRHLVVLNDEFSKIKETIYSIIEKGNPKDFRQYDVLLDKDIVTFTVLNAKLRGLSLFKNESFKRVINSLVKSNKLIEVDLTVYGFRATEYKLRDSLDVS